MSGRVAGRVLTYLLLAGLAVLFLLPLMFTLFTSLKPEMFVFEFPFRVIAERVQWWNYKDAFDQFPFWQSLSNTLTITLLAGVGLLLSASLTAYVLARLRFPGRKAIFMLVLSTMMIPYQVTLIPQYILFVKFGWADTFRPLIVPSWFAASAFAIFLLRQFMMTIPREYDDAARIDGAGTFGIYWRIILPLSLPALAALAIFIFLGHWNDFLGPLIYINSPEKRTLALALREFQQRTTHKQNVWYAANWNHLMAMSMVLILPPAVLYFFTQRYFIQGIVVSGLKG